MDKAKLREVCSKGGRAAHVKGTCHIWTSEEAREAGRKGGSKTKQQRVAAVNETWPMAPAGEQEQQG